jgi:hypothetical protein
MKATSEHNRLAEMREKGVPWHKWGPYLSERQWGTVREDYSTDGNAWNYFSHDQSRSRAYRWGEDGIAGICDDKQRLCLALALWNEVDPILKERLFGLTNSEGNHGEDVKEYYFYLDSTPTHSYMKYLYKYPQAAFPYGQLIAENKRRGRHDFEYELLDTGVFDADRYFDVFVEFAKASPEDLFIKISANNRGPDEAVLHILPTLWFRNTWSWSAGARKPKLNLLKSEDGHVVIAASGTDMGEYFLYCDGGPSAPLFTENETNTERLFGKANAGYVKDGVNEYVVNGNTKAVNPGFEGTKAAIHHRLTVGAGKDAVVRLRLSHEPPAELREPFADMERVFQERQREGDQFYDSITPESVSRDEAAAMRQALAGMLWSKQYFGYDVQQWLMEHGIHDDQTIASNVRNRDWFHMANEHVISMPDKWEYPWYAAWDLAFHTVALSAVDLDFAKQQLDLLLQGIYLHPTGQIPAYEWNFSDVNPPVQAVAALSVYRMEQGLWGVSDTDFLKHIFAKLMLNFGWWINRKDRFGNNLFEGGFLGLDNIGVFDRSAPLPGGACLEQADGTAWMALFCQNMLEIAVELAAHEHGFYEDLACKFMEHFLWIARSMNRLGPEGMWDEEDGFYYDMLRFPDGAETRLKVRSMVGLLPLCATTAIEPWQRESIPHVVENLSKRAKRMPELWESIHPTGSAHQGMYNRDIAALVKPDRLRRILSRMLDENEFLSPYGIRSLSRYHADHPYVIQVQGEEHRISYVPAESDTGMFGGNSNWRGPIWMPVNALLIRGLLSFYLYYGDNFKVECPTGSGRLMNLFEVAREIANRLSRIFLRDASGRRPVYGSTRKFQGDPHWRDYLLFYEYFHGDNGAGIGASHQTGWTGLVAHFIRLFGVLEAEEFLAAGNRERFLDAKEEAETQIRAA